jgi:Xaa-Pro dipeptidase
MGDKMNLGQIINQMHQEGLDGIMLLKPENITYIAGFRPSSDSILLLSDKPLLFTSKLDINEALEKSSIPVDEFQSLKNIKKKIQETLPGKLGVEKSMNLQTYKKLCKDFKIELTDIIERFRVIKSKTEIQNIEVAIQIAENSVKNLNLSGSENEAAAELEYNMRVRGSIRPAFETIVASGVRSSLPHASTSSEKIVHPLVIDWGSIYHNYCSDMTRTIVNSEEQEEIWEIVLEAQKVAINTIKPGIKASYIDKVTRSVIEEYGYVDCFIHSTGHGVGLEVHENPSLSIKYENKLEKGMVVTVEPGIYLEGKFGVRIEDMVHIKNRAKVLTDLPKKLNFHDS